MRCNWARKVRSGASPPNKARAAGKPSANTIYRNVVRETGEQTQCIVLMHDSATTRTTAEALPDIIQWYEDNGFAFLTVEQAVPLPTT